jgi:hypothetical protein
VRETPRPAREEIATIRPAPAFFMPGATARAIWNRPSTLTAWITRQSSSDVLDGRAHARARAARGVDDDMERPGGLDLGDQRRHGLRVGHVADTRA